MKTMIAPHKTPSAKGLVAAATLSLLLAFAALPAAHAQTDHSGGSTPTQGGVPLPKGATTDKGTYTSQDTVGSKAAGNLGTGNTRDMQDGKAGGVQDTTRRQGGAYGSSGNTGTRPRQDTTTPSRSGAPSDTIDGGSKASHESGSRTHDGSQLNRNKTKPAASGRKQ